MLGIQSWGNALDETETDLQPLKTNHHLATGNVWHRCFGMHKTLDIHQEDKKRYVHKNLPDKLEE